MAVTGTVALTNEVRALYDADFYMQGQSLLYFDQLCDLKPVMNGQRGNTYNWPILESQQPATAALDELTDVVSVAMRANEIVITLTERGSAIEVSKFAVGTSYADVYKQAAFANGYNLAESFDFIVRAVAGQGSRQFFQNSRTARSQFNGVLTAADRLTAAFSEFLGTIIARSLKMPLYEDGASCTVMHTFPYYDLLQDTSVRQMSQYSHPELLFNGEVAYWGGMRIVVSANAKGFWGAGAAPVAAVATTLATAGQVGDSNIRVASVANINVGQWITIQDGAETGNTWFDTNELFYPTTVGTGGAGGTGVTGFCLDPGPGDAGGLRYAHASGTSVVNNRAVYPIIVVGPNSLSKAASDLTGPYGETTVTGPFDKLGRILTFGWYAIVGWSRTRNGWLARGECGASQI